MSVSISVITPTFNRAGLIGHTLRSILAQTVPATEIIVVDDGSTDDTAAVVAAFADPRIRYARIQNSGDLAARNTGIRLATGTFVAFCDSDDLWQPTFIERVSELLEQRPDLLAVYTDFSIFRETGWDDGSKFDRAPPGYWNGITRIGEWAGVIEGSFVERLIDFQGFFNSSMVVARDDFLASGGWDEGVSGVMGGDFATTLRIGQRGRIGVVFESLVGVRKHGQNWSGNPERLSIGEASVLEYVLTSRPAMSVYASQLRRGIARHRRDALWHAFDRRDYAAVRRLSRIVAPGSWMEAVKVAFSFAMLPIDAVHHARTLPGRKQAARSPALTGS